MCISMPCMSVIRRELQESSLNHACSCLYHVHSWWDGSRCQQYVSCLQGDRSMPHKLAIQACIPCVTHIVGTVGYTCTQLAVYVCVIHVWQLFTVLGINHIWTSMHDESLRLMVWMQVTCRPAKRACLHGPSIRHQRGIVMYAHATCCA